MYWTRPENDELFRDIEGFLREEKRKKGAVEIGPDTQISETPVTPLETTIETSIESPAMNLETPGRPEEKEPAFRRWVNNRSNIFCRILLPSLLAGCAVNTGARAFEGNWNDAASVAGVYILIEAAYGFASYTAWSTFYNKEGKIATTSAKLSQTLQSRWNGIKAISMRWKKC